MTRNSGFTLIELLIVIAIIGILSGIVLTGVSAARNRSADVRVKSALRQLRVVAENFYDGNTYSYINFEDCIESASATNCLDQQTSDEVTTLKTDLEEANGQVDSMDGAASDDAFCISAPLKSSATTYICVDASGRILEDESTGSPCAGAEVACTFS